MEFRESTNGDIYVFELGGKLMGDAACEVILHRVDELIAAGMRMLVVDMSQVKWMNSQAIAQIIACLIKLRRAGGDLRLAGVAGKVDDYLRITKLDTVIRTYENQQQAINSFLTEPLEKVAAHSPMDQRLSRAS